MKKTSAILIILVLPLFTAFALTQVTTPVNAWGLATHMYIPSEAIDAISNSTWKQVFEYYRPEILAGATTPDQAWQDWDNHLYYPQTGEHNAPTAAQRWFNNTRDNFTAGNWEDGFFALGVTVHYFSDPNIPIHTNETWTGHSAYEGDINANLASLTIGTLVETTVTNVSQMVVDAAIYSHQFYDTVVDAYPSISSEAIMTNATIKAFTESCLTNAINGTLSLFYTVAQFAEPPDVSVLLEYVALVDYAHSNDYIDLSDQLTSLNSTLRREGFEMRKQTTAFTAGDLIGVDLLILTCGLDAYTTAELIAIAAWSVIGNRSILLTGRGDFSIYTDVARPNQVLEAIGSNIRVTDDNVYMTGTYQPWYDDLDTIPAAGDTVNLTFGVSTFTMYSPSSLYFLDDDPVLPVIMADVTGYQTDQTPPVMEVIYDDVIDGVYGDQIPLAAVEEVANLRVLVTGTTFFSDFDYGKTDLFDNIVFLENYLHWAVGNRSQWQIPLDDEVGPRISDVSWDPASPDEGVSVNVSVTVTDPSGVATVYLEYNNGTHDVSWPMTPGGGDVYFRVISDVTSGALSFNVQAYDNSANIAIRVSFAITWTPSGTTTTTTTTPTTTTTTPSTTEPTTTTTPISAPPALDMILVLGIGGAIVVLLVVALVFKRR